MDESISIEVSVRMQTSDYWRHYLASSFSFSRIAFGSLLSLTFSWLLLYSTFNSDIINRYGWRFLVVGLIFYVGFLGLAEAAYSLWYTKKLKIKNFTYTFSNETVETISSLFQSKASWAYFYRVKETGNAFKLFRRDGRTIFVPKRSFDKSEDILKLKTLLREKFGQEAYLKKSVQKLGLK
jgi:hypothetical protein